LKFTFRDICFVATGWLIMKKRIAAATRLTIVKLHFCYYIDCYHNAKMEYPLSKVKLCLLTRT